MKKATTLILAMIAFVSSYAQLEVYKTIDDYKNNTPIKYSSEIKYESNSKWALKNFKPYITILDTKEKIFMDSIWGFTYKGMLFRTLQFLSNGNYQGAANVSNPNIKKENVVKIAGLAALISKGKFCYWEIGQAWVDGLNNPEKNKGEYDIAIGGRFYFSNSIESEIATHTEFRTFFNKDLKTYKPIVDCAYAFGQSKGNLKNIKMANKMFQLGGEDGIAYIKAFSMLSMAKGLNAIRDCVSNENKQIDEKVKTTKISLE